MLSRYLGSPLLALLSVVCATQMASALQDLPEEPFASAAVTTTTIGSGTVRIHNAPDDPNYESRNDTVVYARPHLGWVFREFRILSVDGIPYDIPYSRQGLHLTDFQSVAVEAIFSDTVEMHLLFNANECTVTVGDNPGVTYTGGDHRIYFPVSTFLIAVSSPGLGGLDSQDSEWIAAVTPIKVNPLPGWEFSGWYSQPERSYDIMRESQGFENARHESTNLALTRDATVIPTFKDGTPITMDSRAATATILLEYSADGFVSFEPSPTSSSYFFNNMTLYRFKTDEVTLIAHGHDGHVFEVWWFESVDNGRAMSWSGNPLELSNYGTLWGGPRFTDKVRLSFIVQESEVQPIELGDAGGVEGAVFGPGVHDVTFPVGVIVPISVTPLPGYEFTEWLTTLGIVSASRGSAGIVFDPKLPSNAILLDQNRLIAPQMLHPVAEVPRGDAPAVRSH